MDSHTILTAAHVLYDFETHTENNGLQFKVYDDYDTVTGVVITPKSYHIPYNFCNSSDSNLDGEYNYSDVKKWDYGIVTVEEDLSEYKVICCK